MQGKLKALRLAKKMTQKQVADAMGLASPATVVMWENGTRMPRSDKLPALAALYGCTIDDLFDSDPSDTTPAC